MEHRDVAMQQDTDHGILFRSLHTPMNQTSPVTPNIVSRKGKAQADAVLQAALGKYFIGKGISFDFFKH